MLVWMLLGVGCRVGDPTVPVEGHRELCCRAASPDNVSFSGCRVSNHCRANEEVWVRGPIMCGVADPRECDGGRCCVLDLDGLETLEADAEVDAQLQPPPTSEPAPAPAPIRPVPFDGPATAAAWGQ
ncbi:hypothetical protein ENSA7_15380 [Enhygromyxa salina]|uniref:Uncharacterized protein n=2 Tax=Enhygromyxa salina TaxID=215803 RepID=A0A2S9YUG5_9BACT|nr:hypothetical protein ENSA7_15380 [Enhygromyxa salina]